MTFFDDLKKLKESQPHLSVHVWKSENSDYCDQLDGCKNCYLCFNTRLTEDCMYAYDSRWDRDCTDVSYCNRCELCYDSVDLEGCYGCVGAQDCENCTDCWYSYDLRGCKYCFGCVGLRKKQFCVYNEQLSEEEYREKLPGLVEEGVNIARYEGLQWETPRVALTALNQEGCFGNYIVGSKDSYYVFKVHDLEDCLYMYDSQEDKDCVDCCAFNKSELCYGCMENSMLYNSNFCYWCATCTDCEYMMYCFDCENCFGCFGLKYKKYCILNKQYGRDEYFEKVADIKAKMKEDGVLGEGLDLVW